MENPGNTMKIFGIGLSKTGTTSLAHALELLGYKTRDYPGLVHYSPGDLTSIDGSLLDAYDALTDTPIPSFYRELDARYPDAKFILTIRDGEGWLKSCKKQFTQKLADKQNDAHNQLFMDIYGCKVFDEQKFRAGYDRFIHGVQDYFRGRPDKLLIMNVVAGDGWETLCPFLDEAIPDIPFPKANVTQIRWMNLDDLVDIAKEAGQEILRAHDILAAHPDSHEVFAHSCIKRFTAHFKRAVLNLRGGRPAALARATLAAQDVLIRRLNKLNPGIPVISDISHAVPYQERSKWNHFWLIDPLDGEAGFGSQAGEFTVNVALIEDQKPISGVVYAPISGTLYYTMVGKGAFKVESGGQPVRIDAHDAGGDSSRAAENTTVTASKALTLCRLAEGVPGIDQTLSHCTEWQSAAAHAVARAAGKRVRLCNSSGELTYNKMDWSSECVTVS
jgi:3'-phosphoadenosine 5'-phosphosulfate (PAPS) 3'-phosphatase